MDKDREIKQLKKEVEKYKSLSLTDELTGLGNLRKFFKDLQRRQEEAKRFGREFCILMLDLDLFKVVNDTHGHEEGNKILKKVSRLIKQNIRRVDRAYRFGGDEFVVVLAEAQGGEESKARLQKVFDQEGIDISIGIGYTLREADTDMYSQKERKRDDSNS